MLTWKKIDKSENSEGTTITYKAEGSVFLIQSRKRHIPHANREGTWDHTTYVVLCRGYVVKEFYSLKDAKEWVGGKVMNEVEDLLELVIDIVILVKRDGAVVKLYDGSAEDVPFHLVKRNVYAITKCDGKVAFAILEMGQHYGKPF